MTDRRMAASRRTLRAKVRACASCGADFNPLCGNDATCRDCRRAAATCRCGEAKSPRAARCRACRLAERPPGPGRVPRPAERN